jgi:large subunit ribosomal protein L4
MKAQVYTMTGEQKGEATLPEVLFGAVVNQELMAQAVRVYLTRQRQGNANTKSRSEVAGSTRKLYKQKGTGNARHGDIKAPVFVGGGIVHGPVTHPFNMTMPQKMKHAALRSALTARAVDTVVLEGLAKVEGKTSAVAKALKAVVNGKKKPLVVLSDELDAALVALRNVKGLDFVQAMDLHTYEVLNHDLIIMAKEAIAVLEGRLGNK